MSLVATPISQHTASSERVSHAHTLLTPTRHRCWCATVRISNVHDYAVAFTVQTTHPLSSCFQVTPQTGTMRPTSSLVIAVAYCGTNDMSPAELSEIPFQLRSWNPQDTTKAQTKVRFSMEFVSVPWVPPATTGGAVAKDSTGLRHRFDHGGATAVATAAATDAAANDASNASNASNGSSFIDNVRQQDRQDQEHHEHAKQRQAAATPKSSSVARLSKNSSTIVTKCTSISLQLLLFGCMLYLYIFAYPDLAGSVADVMAFKTAVLPVFLLGVAAEKIRRRCL